MQSRLFCIPSFLAFAVAPAIAQPAVTELQNNYSYTQPGLPNYGISPGSLFIIKGTGLATTTNTTEAFPLTTNLNGTSVSVTVNGVTTQPTLYYILSTQIGAVLPEGTPAGNGTLTVTVGGQMSPSAPITVVQSDFGILTYNGAGTGPAYAFDQNYKPITANYPATPGELIVFWGTGVGPDPANDDKTEPQQPNNLANVNMQVFIGGVPATVFYKGRSAYPGVDEVFVYVPTGVPMGCYVSVVTQSDSLVSNFTTLPVAPAGAASCTDQLTIANNWQSLVGRTSANVGYLSLIGNTVQTLSGAQTSTTASGEFKTDNGTQIYSELFSDGFVSPGSCIVNQNASVPAPTPLNAGSSLALSGPGEQGALTYTPANAPAYSATLANSFIPSAGGTFTFTGSGGPNGGVGAFSATANIPPAVTWTNMSQASNVAAPTGTTLNWSGGTPGGFVLISGDSQGSAGIDVSFNCLASASSGTFTIPSTVSMAMPATVTKASLGIAAIGNPATFSASGLDSGFVYGGIGTVTDLANYQPSFSGPQLSILTLASSQTTSGTSVQATLALSGAAPAGGITIALSSSNSAVASVPATVTVPAGSSSVAFMVTVSTVSSSQNVTISANYAGVTKQVSLTVNPSQSVNVFNGSYTGNYSGTGPSGPVSGTVAANINNGTVTVTQPTNGSGTVTANGSTTFGTVLTTGVSCTFTGSLTASGTSVTGSGTFSCTGLASVTGTWSVTRQ